MTVLFSLMITLDLLTTIRNRRNPELTEVNPLIDRLTDFWLTVYTMLVIAAVSLYGYYSTGYWWHTHYITIIACCTVIRFICVINNLLVYRDTMDEEVK